MQHPANEKHADIFRGITNSDSRIRNSSPTSLRTKFSSTKFVIAVIVSVVRTLKFSGVHTFLFKLPSLKVLEGYYYYSETFEKSSFWSDSPILREIICTSHALCLCVTCKTLDECTFTTKPRYHFTNLFEYCIF